LDATRVDHDTFDPAAFLIGNGTIYLMGSPGAQHSVAPIVAALIEDVVDTARHQAAASTTRRLESGLVLMLDECANIAPLGDLPKLVAELGGLGITTAVILQSVASARTIWGEAGERALRDLANITLVWGGQKDVAFLEEISRLAGEHDEPVETVTRNETGTSSSWTPRRMPVLPVGDIANLAPNHAVVVSPHLRPRITHLPSWRHDRFLKDLVRRNSEHRRSGPPVDDAELIRSELARLTDRVVAAEALVRRLEQRVGELSGDRRPPRTPHRLRHPDGLRTDR
jgi:type IV secretion system protein VirD4